MPRPATAEAASGALSANPPSVPAAGTDRRGTLRLPRAQRRTQLITLADELFLARGFDAVSMDDVAQSSGVSKPVIYDHFGSKEHLFRIVLDRHAAALRASMTAAMADAQGAHERFWAQTQVFFAWVAERGRTVSVLFGGAGHTDEDFRVLQRMQVAQTEEMLAGTLRRAGVCVTAVMAAELVPLAEMLAGAYQSLAVWWQRDVPELAVEEVSDRFHRAMWPGLAANLASLARPLVVDGAPG